MLHVSLVPDANGKGLPAAYSFMKTSSADNLEFFYQCLTGVNSNLDIIDPELASYKPIVNIIDKDLTNINLLEKYFPDTRILLCTFHVIKWFKTLLNTKEILDGAKLHEKSAMLELLQWCMQTILIKSMNSILSSKIFLVQRN